MYAIVRGQPTAQSSCVVNHAANTSMEVGIQVQSEDLNSGDRLHTASAYATFVALGPSGRPTTVPPLELETEEDRRRFREAEVRRAARLRERELRRRKSGDRGAAGDAAAGGAREMQSGGQ